jgi:hypothetical protein
MTSCKCFAYRLTPVVTKAVGGGARGCFGMGARGGVALPRQSQIGAGWLIGQRSPGRRQAYA